MSNRKLISLLAGLLLIVTVTGLAAFDTTRPNQPTQSDFKLQSTKPQPPALPQVTIVTPESIQVAIFDDGQGYALNVYAKTVDEVLRLADISVSEFDIVEPSLDSQLEPGLQIFIKRARDIAINVGGQKSVVRTSASLVIDILEQSGITLNGPDYTIPALNSELGDATEIKVVRVSEGYRFEDEIIGYRSLLQPTDQLEIDNKAILVQGQNGIRRKRIRILYEDGSAIEETVDAEWIEQEPIDEVIGYGTDIVIRTLETPAGSFEYWRKVRMRVTSYTASSSGKPPDHPAYGITASGVQAGLGVVAVDPTIVPFRSWVYVPDYGIGFVGDTGGGVKGRWIDLGYDDNDLTYWKGEVDVYYLTPIPDPEKINYLLPEQLP